MRPRVRAALLALAVAVAAGTGVLLGVLRAPAAADTQRELAPSAAASLPVQTGQPLARSVPPPRAPGPAVEAIDDAEPDRSDDAPLDLGWEQELMQTAERSARRHAEWQEEPRDAAWAWDAEAEVRRLAADVLGRDPAPARGLEQVECRSRSCRLVFAHGDEPGGFELDQDLLASTQTFGVAERMLVRRDGQYRSEVYLRVGDAD